MRILSIVSDLGAGGTQRVAVDVARLYASAGYESALMTRIGTGPRASDLDRFGIKAFAGTMDDIASRTMEASNWRPDVVHIHRTGLTNPNEYNLMATLKESNPDLRFIEHSHFGRADYSRANTLIDVHIQISLWCLWAWRKWTRNISPSPIGVYIPHAAMPDKFHPITPAERSTFRASRGIADDAFVYGSIAQPARARWTPSLFQSFARVLKKRPNSHLYIGGLGDNFPELHNALPSDVRSRITIDGFINGDENLRQAYGSIDSFVHNTPLGETFGLVMTEALCCGTPVITVARPLRGNAQCEVVRNDTGGIVIANESLLEKAMMIMQDDAPNHERMRVEGRASVIQRYDKQVVEGMILGLAEHVRACRDREALRNELEADPLFRTTIQKNQLDAETGGLLGSPRSHDLAMQRILMTPTFQKVLALTKRRRLL